MRTLVTGGAGFIGSHLVDALLAAGHRVSVVDNLVTGSRANLPDGAALIEADVRDQEAIARCFTQVTPSVVFHLAAQTLVATSSSDPLRDAQINVLGTVNVIQAAIAAGTRKLVFASSGGTVYGNPLIQPVPETHDLRPISPYGVSKVAGEHYVQVLCGRAGMASTVMRYGNVYGPRDIPASHHVITAFLDALLNGQPPIIEWDGEQAKDYVYVADVAAANVAAIAAGDGEAFNIASGVEISVNEIFRLVCQEMEVDVQPLRVERRPADVRRFMLDCTRADRMLGWTPTTSFADGLRQTVRYYRNQARLRRLRVVTVQ
ncbi:MAG: NAD-dependent epimerase/dehydratase family protein [Candidatus Dormibacter sp.]